MTTPQARLRRLARRVLRPPKLHLCSYSEAKFYLMLCGHPGKREEDRVFQDIIRKGMAVVDIGAQQLITQDQTVDCANHLDLAKHQPDGEVRPNVDEVGFVDLAGCADWVHI